MKICNKNYYPSTFYLFWPPADMETIFTAIITNSLLAAYQRKQIQVNEYELTPQNILGKEPKKRWF